MITLLMVLEIIVAILLIIVILLQSGKGSELGISIGAGASQTLFGGAGAGNFLTKTTAILATIFFVNAFIIGMVISKEKSGSIFSTGSMPVTATQNIENEVAAPVTEVTKKEYPKNVSANVKSEKKDKDTADKKENKK